MLTSSQSLVLGFFVAAWLALVALFFLAPETYDLALKVSSESGRVGGLAILAALALFLIVLSVGVLRRWRWVFWLILLAFAAGFLRIPASALQLLGILPASGPPWYLVFQAAIGVAQVSIGIVMLRTCRRSGVWGRSSSPLTRPET